MGWGEIAIVGVVALIVVGPKDLPVMFQQLGKMVAKVKRMGREFSQAMNEAANASGAADIAKDLKGVTSPKSMGLDALKEATDKFDMWNPGKSNKAVGSETAKLAAERAETARKIHEATRAKQEAKRAAELAEDEADLQDNADLEDMQIAELEAQDAQQASDADFDVDQDDPKDTKSA